MLQEKLQRNQVFHSICDHQVRPAQETFRHIGMSFR